MTRRIRFCARYLVPVLGAFMALGVWCSAHAEECSAPVAECPTVQSLLAEREGYGRLASGGRDGRFVEITSAADSGPGSLRATLKGAKEPLWIRFASDMTIKLESQIRVPSNVTLDGRGRKVTLQDYGLTIQRATNVIVTHLTMDGRLRTFGQAVNVTNYSRHVWLNHLDLSRFADRLIDVKRGSTDVTISWVKFHDDDKVMLINNLTAGDLFANYDRDSQARVTIDHCYFLDTIQRNPRAQIGTVHLFNNVLRDWDFYGMSFSLEARATVEGNVFDNRADRPCVEPAFYPTVEGVERNYCGYIARSPGRSALANGAADKRAYDAAKIEHRYTRDFRAFLRVRDNIYMHDAKQVLDNYRPELVPDPPYCYPYESPSSELEDKVSRLAGNTSASTPLGTLHCAK